MSARSWSGPAGVWLLGGLLAVWAFAPLVALLVSVALHGGVLTGSDGGAASADQFQYLAWIRDSGTRGLISNSFELAPSQAVFLHPMFLISGIAWRLGVGIQLAYLVWKPVAILTLVGGFAAYAFRAAQSAAETALPVLALALFSISPLLPALDWLGLLHGTRFNWVLGVEELSPAWQLWGYPATAIAIGLMPLALLAADRAIKGAGGWRSRALLGAALAGALVAWLHPWQGATLVLIWIGLFLWGRGGREYRGLAFPVLATLAPLVYYEILDHVDAAWKLGSAQNVYPHLSGWQLLGAIAPLGLLAIPAVLTRSASPFDRMTKLWVAAGLLIYFGTRTFPEHALQGLSLPLAVLSVAGWHRLSWTWSRSRRWGVAAVAVAAATIPGVIWSAAFYRDSVRSHVAPYILTAQEHSALNFLERSRVPGGVLASEYLGMAVPAFTGRDTWRGHDVWTPQFASRDRLIAALFSGRMAPASARPLVVRSGARYVLTRCQEGADLRSELGAIVTAVYRFGCVTVYKVA